MTFPNNPDLHCHSKFSDGTLTPQQLANRAAVAGVDLWALTDHDTIEGVPHAQRAASMYAIAFLTGVEISITWSDVTVHIVGLGFDPENAQLAAGLEAIRATREPRAREMASRVERETGVANAYDGALKHAGNKNLIARPHFARLLVEHGICRTPQEAFKRFLSPGRPCFVPQKWATMEQAVEWIRAAGGIAIMAHPGKYPFSSAQGMKLLQQFASLGGGGVEVVHGAHTPEQMRYYAEAARKLGLLASRGCDYHSPKESRVDIGRLPPHPEGLPGVWEKLGDRIIRP